jgi:hypothetical protein
MEENEEVIPMDNFTALLVIAARCYDLLAVIARAANKEEAEKMIALHDEAELFMSPPAYRGAE